MMDDLIAARSQMAISLAFHIIFACIGMAMPLLMATSHWLWLKTKRQVYLDLTRSWSKGVAIFFTTGAVSGTALSFELGLLWPEFMKHAGAIIGMPFSWEGTAFFVEAIALGIFLYGWNKIGPRVHWVSGLLVGISGLMSGMFVITANAWMNNPAGFDWINGAAQNIDPWAAMFNDRALNMGIHMLVAAIAATGFAVAGLHALLLLKNPGHEFHQKAIIIAMSFGAAAAFLQPISGDILAKETAQFQPLKLAAMEAHFETENNAGIYIGGVPDENTGQVNYGLKIPYLLSVLAKGDPHATVAGLNEFDRSLWPPLLMTHLSFQLMVGLGTLMMLTGLLFVYLRWQKPHLLFSPRSIKILAILTPTGFISVEAGWIVTELGRQPWIIYGIMKTSAALTPIPGLWFPFTLFFVLYVFLSILLVWLMRRQIQGIPHYPTGGSHV